MRSSRPATVVLSSGPQAGYSYELSAPLGQEFDPDFKPDLSPPQMLSLGVFGGEYLRPEDGEYPPEWFIGARLSDHGYDASLNLFGVKASQDLAFWQAKGWIHPDDPDGWFQWYCRYYMGRRVPLEDTRQIRRWGAMRRHIAQLKRHCRPGDVHCRKVQRQALLHWGYDSRRL